MALTLKEEADGKVLDVDATGKLSRADYDRFVPEVERLIAKHGKLRVLFAMREFHGWDAGALWEDIKFDAHHHADIERLALVGDKAWERWMAKICKPFTSAQVRYFDQARAAEARQWLAGA